LRETIGGVLMRITPDPSGTAFQPQGTIPGSSKAVFLALGAQYAPKESSVFYPAQGERAARVYFSKIQTKPQDHFYSGGYLRNSQNVQPRFFLHRGSRPQTAGTQTNLLYIWRK